MRNKKFRAFQVGLAFILAILMVGLAGCGKKTGTAASTESGDASIAATASDVSGVADSGTDRKGAAADGSGAGALSDGKPSGTDLNERDGSSGAEINENDGASDVGFDESDDASVVGSWSSGEYGADKSRPSEVDASSTGSSVYDVGDGESGIWPDESDYSGDGVEGKYGASNARAIDEDGSYTSKDDVALYIYTYGRLPDNFITKKQAKKLGWSGGSLEPYAPGKCIGGDYFGNYEGRLPEKKGREYHECDIDTLGRSKRGAKRIIFSNDGLIYYTGDHYENFELLYGEE